jgi:hypothetical protein
MRIVRRTEPPSIQVDDAKTKLDFKVLAEEIVKAFEEAKNDLKNDSPPTNPRPKCD